jgi:hypothetical protein
MMNRFLQLSLFLVAACQAPSAATPTAGECTDLFASGASEGKPLATIGDQMISVEAMEKKLASLPQGH